MTIRYNQHWKRIDAYDTEEDMRTLAVPIGRLEASIDLVNLLEAQHSSLNRIPPDGAVFVGPGDAYLLTADGYPLVITTAGREMMVAHVRKAETVAAIIETFLGRGFSLGEVKMCVQFAATDLGARCVDLACEAGLRNVWAMNSFVEFLARALQENGNFKRNDWAFTKVTRTV